MSRPEIIVMGLSQYVCYGAIAMKKRPHPYFPYILALALLAGLFLMVQTQNPLKGLNSSRASFAQEPLGGQGYFYLPPGSENVSSVTEEQYRNLVNEFQVKYIMPVFRLTGKPLLIPDEWENPYFAGYAIDRGAYMQVSLWGGTARAPGASLVALAGILCHEVGHILGGAPHQTIPGAEWSSTEGQSDFYAGRDCLPQFLEKHPELVVTPEPEALELCEGHLLCARTATAGLELVRFFQRFDPESVAQLSVRTPAPAVDTMLLNVYPSPQCRLDSYVQGALCQLGRECRPPACWLPQKKEQSQANQNHADPT